MGKTRTGILIKGHPTFRSAYEDVNLPRCLHLTKAKPIGLCLRKRRTANPSDGKYLTQNPALLPDQQQFGQGLPLLLLHGLDPLLQADDVAHILVQGIGLGVGGGIHGALLEGDDFILAGAPSPIHHPPLNPP